MNAQRIAWFCGLVLVAQCILFLQSASADIIQLPRTGQTDCYDNHGSKVACTGTGQDGEFQRGRLWPEPRFTNTDGSTPVNGDSVVDKLTGLEWLRDAGTPAVGACSGGGKTWQGALDYVTCLNSLPGGHLGHSDWRLPNVNELRSLLNFQAADNSTWLTQQGFGSVQDEYWSSSTHAYLTNFAWIVNLGSGYPNFKDKDGAGVYVWPVRGVSPALPETGQQGCWDSSGLERDCSGTGEDGELKAGESWPAPRFANPDGTSPVTGDTVLDMLTGLEWASDAGTPQVGACTGGAKTWQGALDYITCLNSLPSGYLGHNDWRLPNFVELRSLGNFQEADMFDWLNGQGFSNVLANAYWSSTTYANVTIYALIVNMDYALINYGFKGGANYYAWPVRGGQMPPVVSSVPDQSTDEDTPRQIEFTVSDSDTLLSSLVVAATSSNQSLIPDANLAVTGTGGSRTLIITPVPGHTGTVTINVTVSDGTATTSTSFSLTITAVSRTLTGRIAGTGVGSINSITEGVTFACDSGSCTKDFVTGTALTLRASPGGSSIFTGWTGACNGMGDCPLTMSSTRDVTATFMLAANAQVVGGGNHATLVSAYGEVGEAGTIQAQAMDFVENLLLDRGVAFTLMGGYDSNYGSNTGWTTLAGTLTVGTGRLTVERLIVQ